MTSPGGYQPPRNPAMASGPGALSRRTDGGPADRKQPIRDLPNGEYGSGKQFRELQQQAPLPASPAIPQAPRPQVSDIQVPTFNAPSTRPDEPVTSGANAGAGMGMSGLNLPDPVQADMRWFRDRLPALEILANLPSASPTFRNYVRRVRGMAAE